MSFKKISAQSLLKFLSSLKLAVIVILALGAVSAWGTFVEAKYNSEIAFKVVFLSPWMIATLGLLAVNLIAVIVDRYPWKKHHLGFILAHVGILLLLLGSVITQKYGIDGSLAIPVGQSSRYIMVPKTDLVVWSSLDGDKFTKLYDNHVDFFLTPPTKENPYVFSLPPEGGRPTELKIINYKPFAIEERKIIATAENEAGAAVRFQLQNERVNLTQWIRMEKAGGSPKVVNLGPAKIILNRGNYKPSGDNEIVLKSNASGDGLEYAIYSKGGKYKTKRGEVRAGQSIKTDWMGITLRVLKYIPHAQEDIQFQSLDGPTEVTTEAIEVVFNGKKYWTSLNSMLRFFAESTVYVLSFGHRRIDIGFDMKLAGFKVGRYQGTNNPSTYASDVLIPSRDLIKNATSTTIQEEKVNISMNEPLKYRGYTFYQSSFQEDEKGNPIVSVLSVNKDPGRWLKYLGSLTIVLGCLVMFYFKRILIRKKKV